jgi:hypothetical protein
MTFIVRCILKGCCVSIENFNIYILYQSQSTCSSTWEGAGEMKNWYEHEIYSVCCVMSSKVPCL